MDWKSHRSMASPISHYQASLDFLGSECARPDSEFYPPPLIAQGIHVSSGLALGLRPKGPFQEAECGRTRAIPDTADSSRRNMHSIRKPVGTISPPPSRTCSMPVHLGRSGQKPIQILHRRPVTDAAPTQQAPGIIGIFSCPGCRIFSFELC